MMKGLTVLKSNQHKAFVMQGGYGQSQQNIEIIGYWSDQKQHCIYHFWKARPNDKAVMKNLSVLKRNWNEAEEM